MFADLFQTGEFSRNLPDPTLQRAVPALLDLVFQSTAANTVSKYSNGWMKWRAWAGSKLEVPVLPAIPIHVALYLSEITEKAVHNGHSISVINSAACSIRWGHRIAGEESPTDNPLVKSVVEAARRKLARPVNPKEPLSCDTVSKIAGTFNKPGSSLADIRFLFILLVGYTGIFRISEILQLQVRDISIFEEYMTVILKKRKNDQYRKGHTTVITRSRKITCPVAITEKVLSLLPDEKYSSYPVVRRIIPKSKRSNEAFHKSLGISYSTARDTLRSYISPFVPDISKYGTHSLRSGGSNDPGFRNLLSELKDRHGGWKNPKSKMRYIEYSHSELAKITKSMHV